MENLIEIDWSTAPDWANYHAIDENGEGHFYSSRPRKRRGHNYWHHDGEQFRFTGDYDLTGIDWRQTLTRRPNAAQTK